MVKCRTSEKKLKAKRAKVKKWMKANMHVPVKELITELNAKLRGHYNYYGLSHNYGKLRAFYEYVKYTLFKTLRRRSQRKKMNWDKFNTMLKFEPLLKPMITVPLW